MFLTHQEQNSKILFLKKKPKQEQQSNSFFSNPNNRAIFSESPKKLTARTQQQEISQKP